MLCPLSATQSLLPKGQTPEAGLPLVGSGWNWIPPAELGRGNVKTILGELILSVEGMLDQGRQRLPKRAKE